MLHSNVNVEVDDADHGNVSIGGLNQQVSILDRYHCQMFDSNSSFYQGNANEPK